MKEAILSGEEIGLQYSYTRALSQSSGSSKVEIVMIVIYIYVYVCVYIIYVCLCVYTYIMYICTYTHTYMHNIHTYVHTHTHWNEEQRLDWYISFKDHNSWGMNGVISEFPFDVIHYANSYCTSQKVIWGFNQHIFNIYNHTWEMIAGWVCESTVSTVISI